MKVPVRWFSSFILHPSSFILLPSLWNKPVSRPLFPAPAQVREERSITSRYSARLPAAHPLSCGAYADSQSGAVTPASLRIRGRRHVCLASPYVSHLADLSVQSPLDSVWRGDRQRLVWRPGAGTVHGRTQRI